MKNLVISYRENTNIVNSDFTMVLVDEDKVADHIAMKLFAAHSSTRFHNLVFINPEDVNKFELVTTPPKPSLESIRVLCNPTKEYDLRIKVAGKLLELRNPPKTNVVNELDKIEQRIKSLKEMFNDLKQAFDKLT